MKAEVDGRVGKEGSIEIYDGGWPIHPPVLIVVYICFVLRPVTFLTLTQLNMVYAGGDKECIHIGCERGMCGSRDGCNTVYPSAHFDCCISLIILLSSLILPSQLTIATVSSSWYKDDLLKTREGKQQQLYVHERRAMIITEQKHIVTK